MFLTPATISISSSRDNRPTFSLNARYPFPSSALAFASICSLGPLKSALTATFAAALASSNRCSPNCFDIACMLSTADSRPNLTEAERLNPPNQSSKPPLSSSRFGGIAPFVIADGSSASSRPACSMVSRLKPDRGDVSPQPQLPLSSDSRTTNPSRSFKMSFFNARGRLSPSRNR